MKTVYIQINIAVFRNQYFLECLPFHNCRRHDIDNILSTVDQNF